MVFIVIWGVGCVMVCCGVVEFGDDGFPVRVPVFSEVDFCKGSYYVGGRRCVTGWVNVLFGFYECASSEVGACGAFTLCDDLVGKRWLGRGVLLGLVLRRLRRLYGRRCGGGCELCLEFLNDADVISVGDLGRALNGALGDLGYVVDDGWWVEE